MPIASRHARPFPDDLLAELALDLRQRLRPGLGVLEPVPLLALLEPVTIESLDGPLTIQAGAHESLPPTLLGMTTIDIAAGCGWIWLNPAAWPEYLADVPRSRFTAAHEAAHCQIHAFELHDLRVRAERDHNDRLEREANRLAARILVPDQALRRLPSAGPEALSRRFGVTIAAAIARLKEWRQSA